MDQQDRLGRIVCIVRGYTVTEVLRDDSGNGVELAGFRVFGKGLSVGKVYATAEEAAQAIDNVLD
jgi:hypothetical protein